MKEKIRHSAACSKCGEDYVIREAPKGSTRCPDCRPVGNADGVLDVVHYLAVGESMRLLSGLVQRRERNR